MENFVVQDLVLALAVLLRQPYLGRIHLINSTDQDALKWVLTSADALQKLARWRIRLLELDFEIVHRAGIKHQVSVKLWRLTNEGFDKINVGEEVPVLIVDESKEQQNVKTANLDQTSRARKKPTAT